MYIKNIVSSLALAGSVAMGNPEAGSDIKSDSVIEQLSAVKLAVKNSVEAKNNPDILNKKLEGLGLKIDSADSKYNKGNEFVVDGYTIESSEVAGPGGNFKFKVKNGESGNFYFDSKTDVKLYNEYDEKLGGMPYLANELVKGKAEFIQNIIKTKRFGRYKTDDKKIAKAEYVWNTIMRQFFINKESSGYRRFPVQSPKLTKYIVENFDELMKNNNITMPISLIKDNYDIIQLNKRAEEKNKRAEEKNKRAEEKNKIAEEYKKRAEEYKKRAEEYKKRAEEYKKRAEEKNKIAEEKNKIAEEYKKRAEEYKKNAEELKKINEKFGK